MAFSINRAAMMLSAVILALLVLCGGAGLWSARQQGIGLDHQGAAGSLLRNHMTGDMMHDAVRSDVLAALASSNPATGLSYKDAQRDLEEHLQTLREAIATDIAYQGSEEVAAVTAQLHGPANAYAEAAERIVQTAGRDPAAAMAQLPGFFEQFRALEVTMAAAADVIDKHADEVAAEAEEDSRIGMIVVIAALLLSVMVTVAVGVAVRRKLVQPLLGIVGVTRAIADGDLHVDLPSSGRKDELGELAAATAMLRDNLKAAAEKARVVAAEQQRVVSEIGAGLSKVARGDLTAELREFPGHYRQIEADFNAALKELRGVIASIAQTAGHLRSGSSEIAQASEDLARRTEGNAASLEQTAAAVTQMDGRLKEAAIAANQTVARADQTMERVSGGRAVADEAVTAMGRVSESAKGIDSVIEGLDKISFQTRVLAMNAAVEAGRAGEAGRGFAVVADLVSALAMRAEEEAKRARDQLGVTQADVETAVAAVEKVDGALQDISGDVEQVHRLLATIAAENDAQATAITEINVAVASMDQSTQQNAAMVEETSAAARNLAQEVDALAGQASQFRIDGGSAEASPRPAGRAKQSDYRTIAPDDFARLTALTR